MCEVNDTFIASKGMVFFIDLGNDTQNGTMFSKKRPCVIVSSNDINRTNPKRISVAPITSRDESVIFELTDVLFTYKGDTKCIVVSATTVVSTYSINATNYGYCLSPEIMQKVDNALMVHYNLAPMDILDVSPEDVTDYHEYKSKIIQEETDISMHAITLQETNTESSKQDSTTLKLLSKPVFKRLSKQDIIQLKKRNISSWNIEECLSFMYSLNYYSTGEIALLLGIKPQTVYRLRWDISNRLKSKGIDPSVIKVKSKNINNVV